MVWLLPQGHGTECLEFGLLGALLESLLSDTGLVEQSVLWNGDKNAYSQGSYEYSMARVDSFALQVLGVEVFSALVSCLHREFTSQMRR